MADTGAPWNIPYVESTDLVRDYPTDSLELANAIADGLDEAGNAGIGSNVVQTVKTDTFTTTSTSFTGVTGLAVSITPTSATSKVLVIAQVAAGLSDRMMLRLSGGNTSAYKGDGGTSTAYGVMGNNGTAAGDGYNPATGMIGYTMVYLDSPATTSSTTYEVEITQVGLGTVHVNRDHSGNRHGASSITAIEVAA